MTVLVVGLIVFLGIHSISIFAADFRNRIASRLGAGPWRGIYSLVSIVGFVLIVWGYGLARREPVVLYNPPFWTHYVTAVLMLPVFPLIFAPYLPGRIRAIRGLAAPEVVWRATLPALTSNRPLLE